jgi:eukaryotic-like serine/threonine-protein kinase
VRLCCSIRVPAATPRVTDLQDRLSAALHGRYVLERELGHGGMATVYLARDLKHKRLVALKVLHPELGAVLGTQRFLREVETAAGLQHPHILPVFDSGETAGRLWYTMPYVEDESLRDRLKRQGRLSVTEAVRIGHEIAGALAAAHERGIIHRDIKPENVLLSHGHALVADFGIARSIRPETGQSLTATGLSLGTPAYMSPEQALGKRELDQRSDVYALGCLVYELLAGTPPYAGATAQSVIAKHLSAPVPDVRHVRPEVPTSPAAAVARAMAKEPAARFATAGEFGQALGDRESVAPASAPAGAGSASGRRFSRLVVIPAVLVLTGIAVVGFWLHHRALTSPAGPAHLAVLPFENLGDTTTAYFADGITDEVRGKLAELPELQVTARSSSNQYKKTTKSPQQIGQELGVQYLLRGTVRWDKGAGRASRVRVSPELVQVSTASTKWQEPFEAPLTDVFQVQAEVAARVA